MYLFIFVVSNKQKIKKNVLVIVGHQNLKSIQNRFNLIIKSLRIFIIAGVQLFGTNHCYIKRIKDITWATFFMCT